MSKKPKKLFTINAFRSPQNNKRACIQTHIKLMTTHTEWHKFHPHVKRMHRGNERMKKPRGKTWERDRSLQNNCTHQNESPLTPEDTLPCSTQYRQQKHIFTQISSQSTGSSQLLMSLWREQHRCPLWWHRLLTELKPLSSESDHSREAYCYMRGRALVKTKQQKGLS